MQYVKVDNLLENNSEELGILFDLKFISYIDYMHNDLSLMWSSARRENAVNQSLIHISRLVL